MEPVLRLPGAYLPQVGAAPLPFEGLRRWRRKLTCLSHSTPALPLYPCLTGWVYPGTAAAFDSSGWAAAASSSVYQSARCALVKGALQKNDPSVQSSQVNFF